MRAGPRPSTVTGRYAVVRQHVKIAPLGTKTGRYERAWKACNAALLPASNVIACPPIALRVRASGGRVVALTTTRLSLLIILS